MLKKIWKLLKKIWKFITIWNELITIPLALILWYFSDTFLRWLDPTSATYDAGIFQIILFAIIQFFIFTGITWIYIKISFPGIYKYLDDEMESSLNDENKQLTQWEKSKIVLWVFSLLFLGLVLLARIV